MANSAQAPRIDRSEILGLAERVECGGVSQEDGPLLASLLRHLVRLTDELREKNASIRRLRRVAFGPSSERRSSSTELEQSAPSPQADASPHAPRARRKGHGRTKADAFTSARRVAVPHPYLAAGAPCPSHCGGRVFRLSAPSSKIWITGGPFLHATRFDRERLRCSSCLAVFTAPSPDGVGDGRFAPSADAAIAVMRYGSGFPFHRSQALHALAGVPVPRSVQWERAETLADAAFPVFRLLCREAARAGLLHGDDTTARTLSCTAENKTRAKSERRGVYTTGVVASPVVGLEGHRLALYFSGRRHAGENVAELLEKRPAELSPPIRMADAAAANRVGDVNAIEAGCWAHARRKFVDIERDFPSECAHVLEQLKQWMEERFERREVEPNSSLGQAFRYVLGNWPLLSRVLDTPGVPLDNNACERSLRRSVLHRKNSLFFKNPTGAAVGDVLMSLVETCALTRTNPLEYLIAIGAHRDAVRRDPAAWLPWIYEVGLARVASERAAPTGRHGCGKCAPAGAPL
jgi:transposase